MAFCLGVLPDGRPLAINVGRFDNTSEGDKVGDEEGNDEINKEGNEEINKEGDKLPSLWWSVVRGKYNSMATETENTKKPITNSKQ